MMFFVVSIVSSFVGNPVVQRTLSNSLNLVPVLLENGYTGSEIDTLILQGVVETANKSKL